MVYFANGVRVQKNELLQLAFRMAVNSSRYTVCNSINGIRYKNCIDKHKIFDKS